MPIVIIGGGVIIGSAIAYHCSPCSSRAVMSWWWSATRPMRGPRRPVSQLYPPAVFYRHQHPDLGLWHWLLAQRGHAAGLPWRCPDIGLHEGGYLYLATQAGEATLRENHALQKAWCRCGAAQPAATGRALSGLALQDVVLGSLGLSGEGWFDGYLLLAALRKKAQSQGVRYVADEAVGFDTASSDGVLHVNAVRLQSGAVLPCRYAVNAGGPWAAAIAGWAGIDLPVVGKRRTVFNLASPQRCRAARCSSTPAASGCGLRARLYLRLCARCDNDADFAPLEPEYAAFEDHIWPTLAERIPGFEALRMQGAWAGYYG